MDYFLSTVLFFFILIVLYITLPTIIYVVNDYVQCSGSPKEKIIIMVNKYCNMAYEKYYEETIRLKKEVIMLRQQREFSTFEINQLKVNFQEQSTELDETQNEVAYYKRLNNINLHRMDEACDNLKEIIRVRNNTISSLEFKLNGAKQQINRLEKEVTNGYAQSLLAQINRLNNDINRKNTEIDGLNSQIITQQSKIQSFEKELNEIKIQTTNEIKLKLEKNAEIDGLNIQISAQQATIQSFGKELNEIKIQATNEIRLKLETIDQQRVEFLKIIESYESQFQVVSSQFKQASSNDKKTIDELNIKVSQIQLEFTKTKESMEKICINEFNRIHQQHQNESTELKSSIDSFKRDYLLLDESKKEFEQRFLQLKEQHINLIRSKRNIELQLEAMNDPDKCFINDYEVQWPEHIEVVEELYDYIIDKEVGSDDGDEYSEEDETDEEEVERRIKIRS